MRATTARVLTCLLLAAGVALPLRDETRGSPIAPDLIATPHRQKVGAKQKADMVDGDVVNFENSPFPYQGDIPEQGVPFLNHDPDGRTFHIAPRGGKLYEDRTYNQRGSLLYVPPAFDPHAANAALVLFFHGNLATLTDVRVRQQVPAQLKASHLDAVLVAPQLAVNALDSSPGRFYEAGFLETYLQEAAAHLADRAHGKFTAADIDALPVVIVAYSGGYLATAFSLKYAQAGSRIRGVLLLDALFGEEPKFASWVAATAGRTFFVSAYSDASRALNDKLAQALAGDGLDVRRAIPPRIVAGDVVFRAAPAAVHNDFVTQAWVKNPLQDLLGRIDLSGAR